MSFIGSLCYNFEYPINVTFGCFVRRYQQRQPSWIELSCPLAFVVGVPLAASSLVYPVAYRGKGVLFIHLVICRLSECKNTPWYNQFYALIEIKVNEFHSVIGLVKKAVSGIRKPNLF